LAVEVVGPAKRAGGLVQAAPQHRGQFLADRRSQVDLVAQRPGCPDAGDSEGRLQERPYLVGQRGGHRLEGIDGSGLHQRGAVGETVDHDLLDRIAKTGVARDASTGASIFR